MFRIARTTFAAVALTLTAHAHSGHEEALPALAPHALQAAVPSMKPTVTGNGAFRYNMNPGWGKLADGSPVGPTHGGIALDGEGRVYVSTDAGHGICVFSTEGVLLKTIAPECSGTHSLVYREEDGKGYLYGAHKQGNRIVKLDLDGNIVMSIEDSEKIPGGFKGLTAVAVAPDGSIYAATGYGANIIHHFSAAGKLLNSFGTKGEAADEFKTCHGLAIDTRFGEPRLLVVDRENRRLTHYTLGGELIGVHSTHLRRPCAVSFFGDYVAVAELQGRVTIVDKSGTPVAFLGDNPNEKQWAQFRTALEDISYAVFTAPHGLAFDPAGNLYVQDWNQSGRVTRLGLIR